MAKRFIRIKFGIRLPKMQATSGRALLSMGLKMARIWLHVRGFVYRQFVQFSIPTPSHRFDSFSRRLSSCTEAHECDANCTKHRQIQLSALYKWQLFLVCFVCAFVLLWKRVFNRTAFELIRENNRPKRNVLPHYVSKSVFLARSHFGAEMRVIILCVSIECSEQYAV